MRAQVITHHSQEQRGCFSLPKEGDGDKSGLKQEEIKRKQIKKEREDIEMNFGTPFFTVYASSLYFLISISFLFFFSRLPKCVSVLSPHCTHSASSCHAAPSLPFSFLILILFLSCFSRSKSWALINQKPILLVTHVACTSLSSIFKSN